MAKLYAIRKAGAYLYWSSLNEWTDRVAMARKFNTPADLASHVANNDNVGKVDAYEVQEIDSLVFEGIQERKREQFMKARGDHESSQRIASGVGNSKDL